MSRKLVLDPYLAIHGKIMAKKRHVFMEFGPIFDIFIDFGHIYAHAG